ncbi:hypothetical protein MAFF211271_11490 [Ralstonia syzygii subsp. indonesiensis]|nr:hypothetical protein MAFF211271_11490 [Ralstonia pseudosolanacearum]
MPEGSHEGKSKDRAIALAHHARSPATGRKALPNAADRYPDPIAAPYRHIACVRIPERCPSPPRKKPNAGADIA